MEELQNSFTWRSGYRRPGSNSWESRSSTRRRLDRCAGIWVKRSLEEPGDHRYFFSRPRTIGQLIVDAVSTAGSDRAGVAQRFSVQAKVR